MLNLVKGIDDISREQLEAMFQVSELCILSSMGNLNCLTLW